MTDEAPPKPPAAGGLQFDRVDLKGPFGAAAGG